MEPSGAPWRVLETNEPEPASPVATPPRSVPWLPIGGAVLAAVVVLAGLAWMLRDDQGVLIEGPQMSGLPGELVDATPDGRSPGELVVDVGGAVDRPGVYHLPEGSRIVDAIAAAGGYGPRVDAERADRELNLAAAIHDGDEIHVPARGELAGVADGGSGAGGGGSGSTGGGLVDLNRASSEELDTLPGIGPVTAAKIIAAREEQPFSSVDELTSRKVIGPATLAKIRSLVTVGP